MCRLAVKGVKLNACSTACKHETDRVKAFKLAMRDCNAVSDPGEVVPIRQAGVEALAATTAGKTDGMPCNLQGIRMKDGRVLPTYDWIANGYPKPR